MFLNIHVVTLYRLVKQKKVPGAKIGKCWVFIDLDLLAYIRSKYQVQADVSDESERSNKCHYTNVKAQKLGGLSSPMRVESEYKKVLGLK